MTQEKVKRPRGTGRIYQPKGSRFLWVQFYVNGKQYRQSTGTSETRKAEKFLAHKLGEVTTQTFVAPKRVTVGELYADMEQDYKDQGRRSIDDLGFRWTKHLEPFFGHMRAANVRGELIRRYRAARQAELPEGGNALSLNATINREVSVLKRMYSLAVEHERIPPSAVPIFPEPLKENDARRGFLDATQADALCRSCSEVGLWLRAMVEAARFYGCRVSELKELKVRQVDLAAKTITLERTKNGLDRIAPITNTVFAWIQQCVLGKKPDDFVFTHDDGTPIGDFRKVWATACKRAGVPDLLFHDLRRTGVRNMIRAGIPQAVAQRISGHETSDVFDRYNIVDERDLQDAAKKMEEYEVRARTGKIDHQLHVVGNTAVQ